LQGKEMSETDKTMVTVSEKEWSELKARLEDAETHRRGLLDHTKNLEHLVSESAKHAKNISDILAEKEKDLAQTKALCYKYEQLLHDFGIDLKTV
jgi:septal ring factor EnvC (AmiA/AmiB activator)